MESRDDVFVLQESTLSGWKKYGICVGFAITEQFNVMLEYGDKSAIYIYATFGTSACNYFLYILVVFDACRMSFQVHEL